MSSSGLFWYPASPGGSRSAQEGHLHVHKSHISDILVSLNQQTTLSTVYQIHTTSLHGEWIGVNHKLVQHREQSDGQQPFFLKYLKMIIQQRSKNLTLPMHTIIFHNHVTYWIGTVHTLLLARLRKRSSGSGKVNAPDDSFLFTVSGEIGLWELCGTLDS